jgi:nitrate/nitrite-specific signal transduction histidine kinase
VLLLVILGLTVKLLSGGGGDARYINLAGRQRMLSQKLSKEVLAFIANPSPDELAALRLTDVEFTRTNQALRSGGMAPWKLDNTDDVEVAAPTDPALLAKLTEVNADWKLMAAAVDKLSVEGMKRADGLKKVEEGCDNLLSAMDEAVSLFRSADPAILINVAGQQRTLSQKLSKEALEYIVDATPELRQELQRTMALFAASHQALRNGGETTVEGRTVSLDPVSTPAVLAKLETADRYWKETEAALKVVLGEGIDAEARTSFNDLNLKVLKGMDEAVALAEQASQAKITTLQDAQLGITALGVLLVVLTIVVASRIGSSIASLQKAADAISLGNVKQPVEVGGIGELSNLSAAFERMRVSLALAVEQLGGDDDDDDAGSTMASRLG